MSRWRPYVPVAVRRLEAKKKINDLKKKGKAIDPIEIQGRNIAKKFWGKLWCNHLESFSDFSNRLPRGRTYVRNGSVCHLGIKEGNVEAIVSGSSLYHVNVQITTLPEKKWTAIKEMCSGQIGSILELLKGQLSDHVMKVVADDEEGLFPKEDEIRFSCDCPDWADMCKHVAAVLYGIASRLDEKPDLLFLLRGVDAGELIATEFSTTDAKSDDLLDDEGLSDIFGIDLGHEEESNAITGSRLKQIRREMNHSVAEFAATLEVTPATIYRWESQSKPLNLQKRTAMAIERLLEK